MSYRKINVNGRTYEYVIGKTSTKIKNVGIFKNADISTTVYTEEYCECCGEPMSELYSWHQPREGQAVMPSKIRSLILSTAHA